MRVLSMLTTHLRAIVHPRVRRDAETMAASHWLLEGRPAGAAARARVYASNARLPVGVDTCSTLRWSSAGLEGSFRDK